MTKTELIFAVLLYLLCGQVFSLVYSLNFRNDKRTAWLGLMGLFFPLYLILDVVITIASGLGAHVPALLARFEKKTPQ